MRSWSYSRLDDVFCTNGGPLDIGGIFLAEHRDFFSIDDKFSILGGNITLEAPVYGVIFEHVDL